MLIMDPMGRPNQALTGENGLRVMADGEGSLLDRILEGLAQPRSRRVLYCLAEEQPQELDTLAAAVAELEVESSPTAEHRERVKIAIYHNVLPKLADLQLIEYDARSKAVCFRETPQELHDFLQLSRQLDTQTVGESQSDM